jgi:hypothetical protein
MNLGVKRGDFGLSRGKQARSLGKVGAGGRLGSTYRGSSIY